MFVEEVVLRGRLGVMGRQLGEMGLRLLLCKGDISDGEEEKNSEHEAIWLRLAGET